MGVGKSSVARHLARILGCRRIDLDFEIEHSEQRRIVDIIDSGGILEFRRIETVNLKRVLAERNACILSLGGGTWTIPENRNLVKRFGFTSIWLESTFEHCWRNIRNSRKERPLARDKEAARKLFIERESIYSLTDWHFIVKPEFESLEIADMIARELF